MLQLCYYFEQNNFITESQFGFRGRKSIESAVCTLFDTVASNLDQGIFTISVFLDLAKAFDSIDRSILINKLELYGVRGGSLTFLRNYFSDRLQ